MTELAASFMTRKRRELEQDLDAILKAPATCDLARAFQTLMRGARDQILTFVAFPGQVDVTNNASKRDPRPAVVQRKMTNGYQATWAAKGEADVRTAVATAALRKGHALRHSARHYHLLITPPPSPIGRDDEHPC